MERLIVELPASAEEWATFDGAELDAKLRELDVAGRRVEAAIVGAAEHAERTSHHQADGHRTVGNWLMATTNCTRGEANARAKSARMVRDLTSVATEFMAGRVGIGL